MSNREKIFLVVQLTVVTMLAIFGKGEAKTLGCVFLIIDAIMVILVIVNTLLARIIFKELLVSMKMIAHLQKERHCMQLVMNGEKQKSYDSEINFWKNQAQKLIQDLKQSEKYLSQERYEKMLAIEKHLANNGDQETGRL